MPVFLISFFLTLVLGNNPAVAAPKTNTTFETTPLSGESDPLLEHPDPSLRRIAPAFQLFLSAGFAGGNFLERDQYQQGPFLALRYLQLKEALPALDYELAIHAADNLIGLGLGKRWYCCPDDDFLPYLRVSANLILKSSAELAGIAEIRRWRAGASAGVGRNFTFEAGVGIAVTGPDLYGQFGYNFEF